MGDMCAVCDMSVSSCSPAGPVRPRFLPCCGPGLDLVVSRGVAIRMPPALSWWIWSAHTAASMLAGLGNPSLVCWQSPSGAVLVVQWTEPLCDGSWRLQEQAPHDAISVLKKAWHSQPSPAVRTQQGGCSVREPERGWAGARLTPGLGFAAWSRVRSACLPSK